MNEGAGTPRLASVAEKAATSFSLVKPLERKIQLITTRPTRAMRSWQLTAQRSTNEVSAGAVESVMMFPPGKPVSFDSEVRSNLRRASMRTSESKDTKNL